MMRKTISYREKTKVIVCPDSGGLHSHNIFRYEIWSKLNLTYNVFSISNKSCLNETQFRSEESINKHEHFYLLNI